MELDEDRKYQTVEDMWAKLPLPPDGQLCEMDDCVELEDNPEAPHPLAETIFVQFKNDGHACYIFVCEGCVERYSTDDFDMDWPENADGSLVEPTRCG